MLIRVAVGAVINQNQEVLIAQRKKNQHLGGLWEFPGGKVEQNESPQQALIRELKEEVGIDVLASEPLTTIAHDYPEKSVELHVFLVKEFEGVAKGVEGQIVKWVLMQHLKELQFPEANDPIIKLLTQS